MSLFMFPGLNWTNIKKETDIFISTSLIRSDCMGRGATFLCKSRDKKVKPCSAVLILGWVIAYRKRHLVLNGFPVFRIIIASASRNRIPSQCSFQYLDKAKTMQNDAGQQIFSVQ